MPKGVWVAVLAQALEKPLDVVTRDKNLARVATIKWVLRAVKCLCNVACLSVASNHICLNTMQKSP